MVCVFVYSVMWYELLIASAISCPLWSSVYEFHKVECAFASLVRTVYDLFVMCCMQFCSAWMCCLKKIYRCLLL